MLRYTLIKKKKIERNEHTYHGCAHTTDTHALRGMVERPRKEKERASERERDKGMEEGACVLRTKKADFVSGVTMVTKINALLSCTLALGMEYASKRGDAVESKRSTTVNDNNQKPWCPIIGHHRERDRKLKYETSTQSPFHDHATRCRNHRVRHRSLQAHGVNSRAACRFVGHNPY